MTTGHGHVLPGNASLTVHFDDRDWWLQLRRRDGEAHLPFAKHHGRPVGRRELLELVPGAADLRWARARSLPGLPESCRAESAELEVHLVGRKGAGIAWERMVQELQAWLTAGRGRRLV